MQDNTREVGNYERGIEVMNQLWGTEMTERMRAIWQKAHPDVERYITAFALGEVWARPTLDLKTRSLICLSAAVALEREGQIRLHTHAALMNGATPEEVSETIIQLMIYASFAAAWQAMVIAQQVIAEHTAKQTQP
ncbi:MAG: 4-carboxymuconolactone decarboxylase [Herpetosiphon sp.]